MAKFPLEIQYSEALPTGKAPAAPADTGAPRLAQEYARMGAGVAGLGRELFQLAMAIQNQKNVAEFSELKRKVDETYFAGFNAITGDETIDMQRWDKLQQDIDAIQSENPKVNNLLRRHINEVMPEWGTSYYKNSLGIAGKRATDQIKLNYKSLLGKGDLGGAQILLDNALAVKAVSPEEFDFMTANAPNDAVLEQMRLAIGNNNPQGAISLAAQMKDASANQMKDRDNLIVTAKKLLDQTSPEASKQLTDLMAQKKITIADVQARRNLLDDRDYQSWTKIAMNPIDKAGNVIATAELKSAAMDVWRGTTTKSELDKRIRDSLADPNGINDDQYANIIAEANKELKDIQAEDIRRFSRYASNVILGNYSGLLQFDAFGNLTGVNLAGLSDNQVEDVKYRMHFLSLYEQGLRDFIRENPLVSGKEFEIFAAEQKMRYWNTTLEGMKAIAKSQGRAIEMTAIPQSYPQPKTKAEFDKLPSGTIYIHPDGRKKRKP